MKPHLDALIGVGWDQLYALMMIGGSVSAGLTTAIMFFLRYKLRSFFVAQSDHDQFRRKLEEEHSQNQQRFQSVEDTMDTLATKHTLNNLLQRQDALAAQMSRMETSQAAAQGEIARAADGTARVEHLMTLVLDHMLERDKP